VLALNVQRDAENKKIAEENKARAAQGLPPESSSRCCPWAPASIPARR
jgi:hypothetical protein